MPRKAAWAVPPDGQISSIWSARASFASTAARKYRFHQKRNFPCQLNVIWVVQSLSAKIFRFSRSPNQRHKHRIPPSHEGRFAIVTDVESGMRWTQASLLTRARICRGRPSRVVLTPRRWRQVGDDASTDVWHRAGDGGKKARSPGRARRKPLTPSRGECRAFSGVTVVTNARVLYTTTRGCGRIGRPAFPAPSVHNSRAEPEDKARAKQAAGSRGHG